MLCGSRLCKLTLAGLLLLAAGCTRSTANSDPIAGPTAAGRRPGTCPLTGLKPASGTGVDRPLLAIKIENSSLARPQAGLEAADVVYEEPVEGGLTWFLALYQCGDAARLGPVRNAHPVDPDILAEYGPAIFAYAGGPPPTLEKVTASAGLKRVDALKKGDPFERVPEREIPHNLYSSTEKLRGASALSSGRGVFKAPPMFGSFVPKIPLTTPKKPAPGSSPQTSSRRKGKASTVFFSIGSDQVRYTYDGASGAYLRSQGSSPHTFESGGRLKATNVLLLWVKVGQGKLQDQAGNFAPEIGLVGKGDALLLRGGVEQIGSWSRRNLSSGTRLTDRRGHPINLAPGNTWIHLIPEDRPAYVR